MVHVPNDNSNNNDNLAFQRALWRKGAEFPWAMGERTNGDACICNMVYAICSYYVNIEHMSAPAHFCVVHIVFGMAVDVETEPIPIVRSHQTESGRNSSWWHYSWTLWIMKTSNFYLWIMNNACNTKLRMCPVRYGIKKRSRRSKPIACQISAKKRRKKQSRCHLDPVPIHAVRHNFWKDE